MYLKKHLKFSAIRDMILEVLSNINDDRANNKSCTIEEVMLTGLAYVFSIPIFAGVPKTNGIKYTT
jgi:hypothetical protein